MAVKPSAQLTVRIGTFLLLAGAGWTLVASLVFLFGTRLIGPCAPVLSVVDIFSVRTAEPRRDILAEDRRRGGLCRCSAVHRRPRVRPPHRRTFSASGVLQPHAPAHPGRDGQSWPRRLVVDRESAGNLSRSLGCFGGLVVGEAYRVDEDNVASVASTRPTGRPGERAARPRFSSIHAGRVPPTA